MKCKHPTPPYYRILVRSALQHCWDRPRHYSKQGPVVANLTLCILLVIFLLLLKGFVSFGVIFIHSGFISSGRVGDGLGKVKVFKGVGPRDVSHQGEIAGWISELKKDAEWIPRGPPTDKQIVTPLNIPFFLEVILPLAGNSLVFVLALQLPLELGDIIVLDLV